MPLPTTTVWAAPAHTRAKIEIVKQYLNAWFPIIGRYDKQLLYLDGFAGPGQYENGEDGSPLVAIASGLQYLSQPSSKRPSLLFLFVEQDERRAKHLETLVSQRFPSIPQNLGWSVLHDSFEPVMGRILDDLDAEPGYRLIPTFLFIDPFGWSGVSMETIRRVLSYPKTEILFTFMADSVNRFLEHPDHEKTFTTLFGGDNWRQALALREPTRTEAVLRCFVQSLQVVGGARYILSFGMVNRMNKKEYYLVHGSNDDTLTALGRMKQAMWKTAPSGDFTFHDRLAGQTRFWEGEPDYEDVRRLLTTKFRGTTVGWDEVRRFILLETSYCDNHFNKHGLRVLEGKGDLDVTLTREAAKQTRKRGTYPKVLRPYLRFHFR